MISLDILFSNFLFIQKQIARDLFLKHRVALRGYVLDIGCGRRPFQNYIEGRYIGVEYSILLNPDIVADARRLPFRDETFDSVMCTEVLEHVPEPRLVIIEMRRVLRKAGVAYVTVPMSWCLHYEPHDYYRFTKYGLKYLLESNGFEVVLLDRAGGLVSLIGVRVVDILFVLAYRVGFLFPDGVRAKVALLLTIPLSLFFYLMGGLLDRIDHRDAIGWAVTCHKKQ